MDNQRTPLLNWAYFCQGKNMDEIKQTLLLTTLELDNTRLKAQEEIKIRDDEIIQLKELLNRAINDKNEAQEKCQRLVMEKIFYQQQLLQQQQQQFQQTCPNLSGISSIEDESRKGISSSDCDESIVSSPILDTIQQPHLPNIDKEQEIDNFFQDLPIVINKPLPETGNFLQAIMKAGPLLQTLLLAGPLPQWRHPPPPMDSYEIPPPPVVLPSQDPFCNINVNNAFNSIITNCGRVNKKRSGGLFDESDSSIETKFQRAVL